MGILRLWSRCDEHGAETRARVRSPRRDSLRQDSQSVLARNSECTCSIRGGTIDPALICVSQECPELCECPRRKQQRSCQAEGELGRVNRRHIRGKAPNGENGSYPTGRAEGRRLGKYLRRK